METRCEKKTIIVAVDIEKTGALYAHPVNSVGFYIAPEVEIPCKLDKSEIEIFKWNMSVNWPTVENGVDNYGDFEARCWDEFWVKHPEAVMRCLTNPVPVSQKTAWNEIAKMIDSLEEKYPEDKYKVKFISDNASFDIANIDYNLEKYANRHPMRYSSKGKYRSIMAQDDMFDTLPEDVKTVQLAIIDREVKHDHDPVNDAHFHYLMYISYKFPYRKLPNDYEEVKMK